jgi:hypothetical protein
MAWHLCSLWVWTIRMLKLMKVGGILQPLTVSFRDNDTWDTLWLNFIRFFWLHKSRRWCFCWGKGNHRGSKLERSLVPWPHPKITFNKNKKNKTRTHALTFIQRSPSLSLSRTSSKLRDSSPSSSAFSRFLAVSLSLQEEIKFSLLFYLFLWPTLTNSRSKLFFWE